MTKRKFTIELDESTVAMIEKVKVKGISTEKAIDGLVHMGLLEVMSRNEDPLQHMLDKLKRLTDAHIPDIVGSGFESLLPKAKCGVMRMSPDGEVEEISRDDLPAEILSHVSEIEEAFSAGIREGKSPNDIMKDLGLAHTAEEAMSQRSPVTMEGNLVHFPTSTKPS